jgi:BirA family biotin operon repressor/biotin-[acetyl-CoA-carboxylase] ligase
MTLRWNAEALWEAIVPALPGFTVEVLPDIDSTNSELMRRARAGQTEPVLLVAERQSAGRGRLGREWHGGTAGLAQRAPGGRLPALMFSLGLPVAAPDWSGLSLAVGVAVAESLPAGVGLKWPNDLWLAGGADRKLAGILIETVSGGPHQPRQAVIGVGINLLPRQGDGLRAPPASLDELWPGVDAPAALARVAPALVAAVQLFEREGFAPFAERFARLDVLAGRDVVLSDGTSGVAQGVAAGGALQVRTDAGLRRIDSAEVSVRPAATPIP